MRRILFFLHYHQYDGLSAHVLYLLEQIKPLFERVVLISNSKLDEAQCRSLSRFAGKIIPRGNTGFDFAGWKEALMAEGWDALGGYDSVTLLNDTCFGPLFDMGAVYAEMEQRRHDFWGMTIHPAAKKGMPGTGRAIPEHIQSYFLCFNKNVVSSAVFRRFWDKVIQLDNVFAVTQRYETTLTRTLAAAGFSYGAYVDSRQALGCADPANAHPDFCVNNRIPLLKVHSILRFACPQYILSLIQASSAYPAPVIYQHFLDNYNPCETLLLESKTIPARAGAENAGESRTAVHLHVRDLGAFEKYACCFDDIKAGFDLYLTTDTEAKKERIQHCLDAHSCRTKLKAVMVTGERTAWLAVGRELSGYDAAGHFYAEDAHEEDWRGISRQEELLQLLLRSFDTVVQTFQNNPKIGVIIPDTPCHIRAREREDAFYEAEIRRVMDDFWGEARLKKRMRFKEQDTLIMPYGAMFWYRPAALRPLFGSDFCAKDLPASKYGMAAAAAIERLPVYVAWSEGFDYRIMTHENPVVSSFADTLFFNREMKRIKQLWAYRLGVIMLFIPKAIRCFFKKSDEP